MLQELCTVGRAGCQNRPFFRRDPISENEYRGSAPCPQSIKSITLPEELRRLYEDGGENEYYLGDNLTFFSPSYVSYLYRAANSLVDVAIERVNPVKVWSYDKMKGVMVSDHNDECSFQEFVIMHI
jgi:hypothetical protein